MEKDLFTDLPAEIITDILSRLPVRTIMISKCVSKSWLQLLKTDEFVNSHLSKSVPMLAVLNREWGSSSCTVFEFEDGLDLEEDYNPFCKFNSPYYVIIQGSANGLLLLYVKSLFDTVDQLCVCNPITFDFVELHCPKMSGSSNSHAVAFGFGASKITGQLKVVRIINDFNNAKYECDVHTLGTESWRRIELDSRLMYEHHISGAFVNGSLYWIVSGSNGKRISCFDLEAEHLSSFATPPLQRPFRFVGGLSALGDHLCLCECDKADDVIVIWLMKEHGVDNFWTKQYVIDGNPEFYGEIYHHVYAIAMSGDGDILLCWDDKFLSHYSSKTKTIEGIFKSSGNMNSILLTPSFLSPRSLGIDGVFSL